MNDAFESPGAMPAWLPRAASWILRVGLGGLVLISGFGKIINLSGFVQVLETYRLGLTQDALWTVAIAVSAVELTLGAWLLTGRRMRQAVWISIVLSIGYAVLLGSALLRGLELSNCGCFGVFFARPLLWYSPLEDIALVAASYALLVIARPIRAPRHR